MLFNICIKSLKIFSFHGAYEQERKNGQFFLVDALIDYKVDNADDNISNVLDYARVVGIITDLFNKKKYKTLEKLSVDISDFLCNKYSIIKSITIIIKKTKPPINNDLEFIEVSYTRSQ